MNVLKFGGTSVGSAQRIQEVAKLISDDQPKIVVLSAMSGTTNTLVDITNYLYRNDRQEALTTIQNLELDYLMTISDLYSTEEFKHRGQEFVQTIFTYLRSFINKDFYPLQEKAVVAQGEILPVHSHIALLRFAFLLMFGARLKVFSAPLCKHRCSKTFLRCKLHIFF